MKPSVLICIAAVWMAALAAFYVFASGDYIVGFHARKGRFASIELVLLIFAAGIVLLGWLIPLSIGILRLVRKS